MNTVHRVGRYLCQVRPLARDAQGSLYEGTDSKTGDAVYLKELRSPGEIEALRDSLRAAAALGAPALLPAYDEMQVDEKRYAIAPKTPGQLLTSSLPALREAGVSGRHRFVCALVDVCSAVEALHSIGAPHGGINAATIVVTNDGPAAAQLLYFGPFEPRPASYYVPDNEYLLYVSQEQLRGKRTAASDIYALSMLLHLGLGATLPFSGDSPFDLAEQIVWGQPAPFVPHLSDLDPGRQQAIRAEMETVGALTARGLQRNPGARYASVGELRVLLQQLARGLEPIKLGLALYHRAQFEQAAAVLEEAAAGPDPSTAYVFLGRIYGLQLNDYDRGVVAFKRALKVDPALDSPRLGLAEIYSRQRRFTLAKRELLELLESRPDDPQLMMAYARILETSGSSSEALNVLHRLREVNPYFLPAHIKAIEINLSQGNLKEAENDCDRAIKSIVTVIKQGNLHREQIAEVFFLRGLLHRKQGRPDRAIVWLEKSLEQMPLSQRSHTLLAELYAEVDQPDKMLQHFLASLNIDPEQEGILDGIAQVLAVQGSRGRGGDRAPGSARGRGGIQ